MKHHADIDRIFKEGIRETDYPPKDAMWARMEQQLDNGADKRRRRLIGWLLPLLLITAGSLYWFSKTGPQQLTENVADKQLAKDNNTVTVPDNKKEASGSLAIDVSHSPVVEASDVSNNIAISSWQQPDAMNPSRSSVVSKGRTHASNMPGEAALFTASANNQSQPSGSEEIESTAGASLLPEIFRKPEAVDLLSLHTAISSERIVFRKLNVPVEKAVTTPSKVDKAELQPLHTYSVEVVAGSDIFNLNKKVGYYAGVRINKHLDKGTVISAGINYSFNALNEKYRLSSKPVQQQEADAQLNSIKMIRVPVYFQRQLPGTKISLMAGLVPSYIIDASVYNVPGSFTGNPNDYRKFTMRDINRLNLLFGAGIKYSPLDKISFEVSGSYGFTGLVKDSYINQSRVNDNFKNIQAGIVYRIH